MKKVLPESRIVELTDDEATGSVNAARVDEAIAQAGAVVDAYSGERYGVPLSPVPEIIRKLSLDIALYHLFARTMDRVPVAWAERYRDAMLTLQGISRGTVSLGVVPSPNESAEGRAEANRTEEDSVFDRDSLKGF